MWLFSQGNPWRKTRVEKLHGTMNIELGVNKTERVNVVRHDLKLDGLDRQLLGYPGHNPLQPDIDTIYQDLAAVLWTPYEVVLAGIDDVVVRPKSLSIT
jgi:hypothetical protein